MNKKNIEKVEVKQQGNVKRNADSIRIQSNLANVLKYWTSTLVNQKKVKPDVIEETLLEIYS